MNVVGDARAGRAPEVRPHVEALWLERLTQHAQGRPQRSHQRQRLRVVEIGKVTFVHGGGDHHVAWVVGKLVEQDDGTIRPPDHEL